MTTTYSHPALVAREQLEVARFVARMLRTADVYDGTQFIRMQEILDLPGVVHDSACCTTEPWFQTIFALVAAEARDRRVTGGRQ